MKSVLALALPFLLAATPALAQPEGYRDCSLQRLSACQNSNQLFFSLHGRKKGFAAALNIFLRGTPPLYLEKNHWPPAQIAQQALTGPGDIHRRLPSGEWLFDGFTPHDATDRGAVLFRPEGAILAVALLDTSTDTPTARATPADYRLRIYSHDTPLAPALLRPLRAWGSSTMGTSIVPGVLPVNRLVQTAQIVLRQGRWTVSP